RLRPGMLFRSATLDEASERDLQLLVADLGIRTIIDLRSPGEARAPPLLKTLNIKARTLGDYFARVDAPYRSLLGYISPWFDRCAFVLLNLMGRRNMARRYLVSRSILGAEGLFGMNRAFIERCTKDVHYILCIMLERHNWPILVHCTAGKDRTGFTVAVIQLLCGVPEEEIVADYVRSQSCLGGDKMGQLVAAAGALGLEDKFGGCPPDVMVNTIHYIRTKYQTVDNYLLAVGITFDQQATLRSYLI
ncbi:hypothetical protein CXG81DRAFT_5122, partial [Caulochytrium protostelioides]